MTIDDRITEALRRIAEGVALRIPADPCDADLVLSDAKAELAALRAQLEAVTRERDGYREALEMANAAAKTNAEERDEARAFAADREGLALQLDAAKETVQFGIELRQKAEADAARLREALTQVRDAMRATGQEPDGDDDPRRPVASAVWHALASTPSAELTRAQAERWLSDGPEVPGGTLAFHAAPRAEPSERDMRVAEAVRDFERWPVVLAFARAMVRKLDQHAPKKGGRECWRDDDPMGLANRVAEELRELREALIWKFSSPHNVLEEAADVANMAMMTADAAGALDLAAVATKAVKS